jgi:hypothetical protein
MNATTYQRNQMMQLAMIMVGSIVTAVVLSTMIIMSLMHSEIAGALSANNNTATQTGTTCTVPVATVEEGDSTTASSDVATDKWLPANVTNSFNTTNTNTTTNTENNYDYSKTIIKDSYNKDSYNTKKVDVDIDIDVKDNGNTFAPTSTVITGNTVNSNDGNSVKNETTNVISTDNSLTNKDSNNTSVLSDNNVDVDLGTANSKK